MMMPMHNDVGRIRARWMPRWTGVRALRVFGVAFLAASVCLSCLFLAGCGTQTVKDKVDSYSWAELSAISTQISEAQSDEEGLSIAATYHLLNSSGKLDGTQTKTVTLSDGTAATVTIAGFRQDELATGGMAGISFVFTNAPFAYEMNESSSNEGGWEKSEMRTWLNGDFTSSLPSDLKQLLASVNKKTNNSASTTPGAISKTADKVWLLSEVELCGSISPGIMPAGGSYPADTYNAEGTQYKLFSDMKTSAGEDNDELVRTYIGDDEGSGLVVNGEASPWWLRSLSMNWTAGFAACDAQGNPFGSWFSDYELGVAPGFCL